MKSIRNLGIAAAMLTMSATATFAADKWDMPLAYSATNYHSENAAAFAKAVTDRTKGELEIVTHASGSLFKGGEIFGAVRKGLAPIGERLVSALGNEDAIFEIDALPLPIWLRPSDIHTVSGPGTPPTSFFPAKPNSAK